MHRHLYAAGQFCTEFGAQILLVAPERLPEGLEFVWQLLGFVHAAMVSVGLQTAHSAFLLLSIGMQ